MKATMIAFDQIKSGANKIIVSGGMESMTNAPHLLPRMRKGARHGHGKVVDHMFADGLEDAYETGRLMGSFAEECAEKYQFSREAQDTYAIASHERASRATAEGTMRREITPYTIEVNGTEVTVERDEQLDTARPDKIPLLKPAFKKDGTITAANASSISDGAAALVLMSEQEARRRRLRIRARILGHSSHALEPSRFATAPIPAVQKLMTRLGMSRHDVDLWEINEAFAVVPMAAMAELGIDHTILNVHGGACALGHPIGASGARIITTLLNALDTKDKTVGIAAICIGGGEATALAVERVD
jgi:acetyl-CoA C-acetyltransferase